MVEQRLVAVQLPACVPRTEAQLLAVASGHRLAVLEKQRDVDLGPTIEAFGQLADRLGAEGQAIDLTGAVRGADGDVGALETAPPEEP
jgi:hypothetical protein